MLMESGLKPLSKPKNWLLIFFLSCLALHAYLAYSYFTYEIFNDSERVFKGYTFYTFGIAMDLIALLILPFAIWWFIKETAKGWVLIVIWLLLR